MFSEIQLQIRLFLTGIYPGSHSSWRLPKPAKPGAFENPIVLLEPRPVFGRAATLALPYCNGDRKASAASKRIRIMTRSSPLQHTG